MTQVQDVRPTAALHGVRVIEIGGGAASSCALYLAWLGADVVKIETPHPGDGDRYAASDQAGIDCCNFILHNANKRSVVCDLATDAGKQQLKQMLAFADVAVEHLPSDSVIRADLQEKTLRALNPALIYVRITGFAADGPRADYLCDDAIAQAAGGSMSGTGYTNGPPLLPGLAIGTTATALHTAMAVLGALHQRAATAQGQHIQVDMQAAVIAVNRNTYQIQLKEGKPAARMGNRSRGGGVPSDLYACKPGGPNDYVFIAISSSANKHWRALLKAMGREDLADDARYSTPAARRERRQEIDGMVADWCKGRTKVEVMESIQGAGAPAGAVFDMHNLALDPDLRRRGIFATVEHPARGAINMPGWPVQMSDSSVTLARSPMLGEHTQQVMAEWAAPHAGVKAATDWSGTKPTARALTSVKVVDLTQFEAGTSCTQALAWLGADVVKVEEPQLGDRGRYGKSDKAGVDSHYFILFNANKRSLSCDLKSDEGKSLLRRLIASADVMIENMAPGVIERLGFDYQTVRSINPGIVFAQIKGFPADGRYAKYLCFDMIAQAVGGSVALTGSEGMHPVRTGPNIGDTGSGLHCATGILAALYQRLRTGRGQHVQVTMQEAVINFCREGFAAYLAAGKSPQRRGNGGLVRRNAPYGAYRCLGDQADDYCFVGLYDAGNEQWHRLLNAIGRRDLLDDARYCNPEARLQREPEVDGFVAAWCGQRSKLEVQATLQRAGVPAAAIVGTQEVLDDPELRRSGAIATMLHPHYGAINLPGWPVKMSRSHVVMSSAPVLGAHTDDVIREWLDGMGSERDAQARNNPARV